MVVEQILVRPMSGGGSTQSPRVPLLDGLKGVGILLVVFSHSNLCEVLRPGLAIQINSVSMPLFFVLSGVCFDEGRHMRFAPFALRRAQQLLLPVVVFNTIFAFVDVAQGQSLVEAFCRTRLRGALWFPPVLWLAQMAYWGVWHAAGGEVQRMWAAVAFALTVAIVTSRLLGPGPFEVLTAFAAMGFYGCGHLLRPHILSLATISPGHGRALLGGALAVFTVVASLLCRGGLSFWGNHIETAHILIAAAGVAAVTLLLTFINAGGGRILVALGRNTMALLLVHQFFNGQIRLAIFPPIGQHQVMYAMIELAISLSLSLVAAHVFNSYAPWLVGKEKKGKTANRRN